MVRDVRTLEARRWALWYRERGYNPLPSRTDAKRPALRSYADERDSGIPDWFLEQWWGSNIQLALGVRWNLIAVDLDGPQALTVWRLWSTLKGCPATWTVRGTNADGSERGRHLWFRPPAGVEAITTRVLWGVPHALGGWQKGSKVELLGDRALLIAPPSRHVKTGQPYQWVLGPAQMPDGPAELPAWVLAWRPSGGGTEDRRPEPPHPLRLRRRAALRSSRRFRAADVLAAIPPEEKVNLAREWGVRFASERPNASGWLACHRDAQDRNPSASFNVESGYWWSNTEGRMSLFWLGVRQGVYSEWTEARDDLGMKYGA